MILPITYISLTCYPIFLERLSVDTEFLSPGHQLAVSSKNIILSLHFDAMAALKLSLKQYYLIRTKFKKLSSYCPIILLCEKFENF